MLLFCAMLQVLLLVYTASLQAYNICGMVTFGETAPTLPTNTLTGDLSSSTASSRLHLCSYC
jgi:hypothetical protein